MIKKALGEEITIDLSKVKKKFLKKDYTGLSEAVYNDYGELLPSAYLRGVDNGVYSSKRVKAMLEKYNAEDFVGVDYKELSKAISDKLNKVYTPAYVKKVLCGDYGSALVFTTARKLLMGR